MRSRHRWEKTRRKSTASPAPKSTAMITASWTRLIVKSTTGSGNSSLLSTKAMKITSIGISVSPSKRRSTAIVPNEAALLTRSRSPKT